MWRKTFIRLVLLLVLAISGLMVFVIAAGKSQVAHNTACRESREKKDASGPSEFLIFDSFNRILTTAAKY